MSKRAVASFHIVTGGRCWLTVEGIDTPPVLLNEGDLVILPHGHAHTMTDHPQTPVTSLEELVPKPPVEKDGMVYRGGQGAVTALVCGGLQLEDHATNPLFSLLPPLLHMKSQHGQSHPWLEAIVQVVKAEASANQPAAKTVITRFSEILFLQAVRTYMSTVGEGKRGWFNALQDPQIGQALALIQHQPDEPWTVESLASCVSLSRSAFSAKFKQLVGQSPMQYVTRVRLTKAAALLRTQPVSGTTLRLLLAKRSGAILASLPVPTGKEDAHQWRIEHSKTVIHFSE